MNKNYTKMATYSFCEACQNSVSSNWRVYKSELEGMFDVELDTQDLTTIISEMLKNFGNAILDITLDKDENIAICKEEYAIDFIIGTNYCLNVEEENDKTNKEINGMPLSRYIAALLLSDSNLKGDRYYAKEDEYTEIIEKVFEENEE